MTKRIVTAFFFCIIPVIMHSQTSLSVAAAANLNIPMTELESAFNSEHPDIKLTINYGSSGKLTAQILEGAPFDIFLAADTSFPQKIFDAQAGVVKPVIYASGKLVLFSVIKNSISKGLGSLTSKKVKTISIANPDTAPYGRAALNVIKKYGIYDDVEKKLVYAESISQVVQQAVTASDVGFIAKSSLYAEDLQKYNVEKTYWIDIDTSLYEPIDQAMIIIKNAKEPEAAGVFYNFILSVKAAEIFKKYGYDVK